MNADEFRNSPSGYLVPTENSRLAFVPNALPPADLGLEPIIGQIARVHTLVGQLAGAGRRFSNPYLLIRPLQRKEAVASSSMEGTYTTLQDLLLLELGVEESKRPPDTREVLNYIQALQFGLAALADLPVSTRLIQRLHAILLQGVQQHRGGAVTPGTYKRDQNYIGGSEPDRARFVPPPPAEVGRLMSELETFINSDRAASLPPLVVAAMAHCQFETIHPFPDGNGRVGRILIPLILKEQNVLDEPLLFLSPVIEQVKDEYIQRLYDVNKNGSWLQWIEFFLNVVKQTCEKTISTVQKLHDLNLSYLDRVQKARTSALQRGLVNSLFEWPVITIPAAAERLDITYPAAKNNMERLAETGIVQELHSSERPRVFFAPEIIDLLEEV